MSIRFLILLFTLSLHWHRAQTDSLNLKSDSAKVKLDKKKVYSTARKATIMSAILPGLGQVYNNKYWKVPIVYAGLAGFGYMFWFNNDQYNVARKYLKAEYDSDTATVNDSGLSGTQLLTYKGKYRKRRDIGAIGILAVYVLNIIDANVDAHLRTFDVSDDLSIQIRPWENIQYDRFRGYTISGGLSMRFLLH